MLLNSIVSKKIIALWPSFFTGMVGALFMLCFFHFIFPAQKIGTVNIIGILDQFIKENAKQSISSDQLKIKVRQLGKSLEETLEAISKKDHVVLLPREAVIAGSRDYTLVVSTELKKSLAETIK